MSCFKRYYKPIYLILITFFSFFISSSTFSQSSCPPSNQTRVMLLGDSWTHIMWDLRTYRDVFHQFGFGDKLERGNNTAVGGTTASYWAQPANLATITNELQQHPAIDIVLISIGGNDMLAGMNGAIPGWHTGMNASQESALFDRIQADMQTMIDAIKTVRPNIHVLFSGYDYINLVETVLSGDAATILLWANLGQPNALQINTAFSKLEQRKINMANADPHIHYVNSMGLMQWVYGYPNIFLPNSVPAPGQQPPNYAPFPGGNPDYPTPPIALAAGGSDAIHLSAEGYRHFVVNQTVNYFLNKFRGNPNASFKSQGGNNDGWVRSDGTTGTGAIRMGDMSSGSTYRGIVSFNTAAIPDNATITGASLFINRASLSGSNPFSGGFLGLPVVDVKQGSFGADGIEVSDYFAASDASNAGCFIGTVPSNGYTIRIDLTAAGFQRINKTGLTQFRVYFPTANASGNDYVTFNNGDQPGLFAPYLDVFYSVPPPPATAVVSGNTVICTGSSTNLHVALSGTPPFTITWSDGVTENNILTNHHTRTVQPITTTQYQITQLSDVNGTGTASGAAIVETFPQIQVSVTGLASNYCVNSPVSTLFAAPPSGSWSGPGISGNTFNPALAIVAVGGGLLTLTFSGFHNGCSFSRDFSVIVDTASCTLSASCDFSPVSGSIPCVGMGPVTKTYESSGRLWVFEDLIPGKTYIASTCDSCGYDSHLMVRDEADTSFITENDDACAAQSSVTFIAPASGQVGINLSGERNFDCNPYDCNPTDCNPYNCNPYNCNPTQCNCQTCYQTCYREEDNYLPCSNDWDSINGILTSPCVGACTFGGCWRRQYDVPYNCNPYTCNCQTCYDTCYDTCFETCYDTCYQSCTDKCGTDNFIQCEVLLTCVDCHVPTAVISASNTQPCAGDSVSFQANLSGATCNTEYLWDFGADAVPATSADLHPHNITWMTSGAKQITFHITEPGLASNVVQISLQILQASSGGNMSAPVTACEGDTVRLTLDSVQNASGYFWYFSGANPIGSGAIRELVMADSIVQVWVMPINGGCEGDTFYHTITPKPAPQVSIVANGDTALCPGDKVWLIATADTVNILQWVKNDVPLTGQQNDSLLVYQDGIYHVIATDSALCSAASNAIAIVEYPAPAGYISGDNQACEGDTIEMTAVYYNFNTLVWFENGNILPGVQDTSIFIFNSGNYAVVAMNNYCTDTSAIMQVTFHNYPPANAGQDIEICTGDTATLSASGGNVFFWNHGATAAATSVTPNVTTTYIVEVYNYQACSSVDSVTVLVFQNPPVPALTVNGNEVTSTQQFAGYQWYLDGTAIQNANAPNYIIQVSGNYQLEVTDSNGCSSISSAIYLNWTGISEIESGGINVYPNPVTDELYVEFLPSSKILTFTLCNILGERIYTAASSPFDAQLRFDLSKLSSGIYLLQTEGGKIFKVVKE